jgi:hypothetical protein
VKVLFRREGTGPVMSIRLRRGVISDAPTTSSLSEGHFMWSMTDTPYAGRAFRDQVRLDGSVL